MLEKIFIRLHQGIFRIGNKLPDDDALRHIEFALGIVDAIRFEEYVDACALLFTHDFAGDGRNIDEVREVHAKTKIECSGYTQF